MENDINSLKRCRFKQTGAFLYREYKFLEAINIGVKDAILNRNSDWQGLTEECRIFRVDFAQKRLIGLLKE